MKLSELNQSYVDTKLMILGDKLLNSAYKNKWSPEQPTTGYCYIVSEAIYHFIEKQKLEVYFINLGINGVHWYLKNNDSIVDLTANQFDFPIDYSKGKRIGFMKGRFKTDRGYISNRGLQMARYLELI